ncbi:MAG: TolC family protein [Flavobacteriales bacterium]|nr:TolC family protein [Flavobacteriales bacterium]
MTYIRPYALFTALSVLVGTISAQEAAVLTLKDAIAFGRANSPTLVIAANDRERADAQATEAVSGYLPQINGNGQFDNNLKRATTILPAGAFGDQPTAVQFGTQYNTGLSVMAEQTLIDVAQLNGIQASRPNTEMARIKEQQTEEQLIYEAARSYAQALTYRTQLRLLDDNQAQYDELVPILKLRLEKGVAQPLDVDRVEVMQRNIRSQRTVAEASYTLAVDQLKRVIGMPLDQNIALVDSLPVEGRLAATTEGPFQVDRLRSYQYNEEYLLLYGIDVKRKRNAFLPTLSAFGRYGANAFGNDLSKSYDNWYDYGAIGLKLNVPIFSGLRRVSQIKQSELTLSNAREQQKLSVMGWELDHRNADTRLKASTSNVENDAENLRLAERVFDITDTQYKLGTAQFGDLISADYQLKEARNNYTNSLLQHYLAVIDMNKAKGTLLEFANAL